MTEDTGQTRADRADAGEHEQDDLEMFPLGSIEGEGPSPQGLVRKGLPVQLTVAMSQAEVPMTGSGLLDPDSGGRLLVSYLPGKVEYVPVREDKTDPDKVTGWKLRQRVRVTYTQQVQDIPALITQLFGEIQAGSPGDAGRLLDDLRDIAASGLRSAA